MRSSRASFWRGPFVGAALLAVVATADYLMGSEIGSDTLYLAPVACVAWFAGLAPALAIALVSVATWLYVDMALLSHTYSNPAAPWCNAAIAGSLFAAAAAFVTRLKTALSRERELSRLKSDLLSAASRELGNSLAILTSGLGFIKKELGAPEGSKTGKLFEAMEKAHASLNDTIRYLLDSARAESGGFSLELAEVDLRGLVEEYASWAQPLIAQSSLDVRLEFLAPTAMVRADRVALSLIVSNLIHNAIKNTLPMGRILVTVKKAGSKIEMSVVDEGIGVPAGELHALAAGPDAGADGLAITRQLIEGHGGRLVVDSEPGSGTRFSFQLDGA